MTEKTNTTNQTIGETQVIPHSQMGQDLRNAVLVVSLVANLAIFTTWVALQVTTQFDTQLAALIFNR